MDTISVVRDPELSGTRLAFVLAEDRLGHYEEFRDFFTKTFELDRVGLAHPGYVLAPSGHVYALVITGRSGEVFPSGVEIFAIVDALEPLEEVTVDRDVWEILRWMVQGVGEPWKLDDLDATARLYRIPPVAER